MPRISPTLLKQCAKEACEELGLDYGPLYDGQRAIVGRVSLQKALNGWKLVQVVTEGGGERELLGWNNFSAAEMLACLDGMRLAARLIKNANRPAG